jgi:hypothetical protein
MPFFCADSSLSVQNNTPCFVQNFANWFYWLTFRSHASFALARSGKEGGDDAFSLVDYQQQRKPKQFTRSRYTARAVRRYPTQPTLIHDRHYAKQLASGHSRKRGPS